MTRSVEERTAVNEQSIVDIRADLQEIKAAVQDLQKLAQQGSGILRTLWTIGSIGGWVLGGAYAFTSIIRGFHH